MLYQELGYAFPTRVACPYESDFEPAFAVDQNGNARLGDFILIKHIHIKYL